MSIELVSMPKTGAKQVTLSRRLMFARNFLKNPGMLGSIVPSSRFLVNDLLTRVDWHKARAIVEFGPGVGTITQHTLRRMRPDAKLVAIELNHEFATFLRSEIRDPRLHVVCGSASDVGKVASSFGLAAVDYIISGIPLSLIPSDVRLEILQQSRELLSPGGALLVYQFTGTALPHLKSVFGSVRQGFQPLNILPARIFHCTI